MEGCHVSSLTSATGDNVELPTYKALRDRLKQKIKEQIAVTWRVGAARGQVVGQTNARDLEVGKL